MWKALTGFSLNCKQPPYCPAYDVMPEGFSRLHDYRRNFQDAAVHACHSGVPSAPHPFSPITSMVQATGLSYSIMPGRQPLKF